MDQGGLASHKKKAFELRANLVFLDESGFLMAPLVRRSWAPRRETPILYQRMRAREKVSAISALCISPTGDRVHLYFRLHPNASINSVLVIDFLRNLLRQLNAPVVLAWDRLSAHRSKETQTFIESADDLNSEFLPPYAPELNPVEYVWGYLKTNPLSNLAPADLDVLTKTARHHARSLQRKQKLLRGFVEHSPLSIPLK